MTLARMNRAESVWRLLQHVPEPRLRNFVVNWIGPYGCDPELIVAELDRLDSLGGKSSAGLAAV